MTYVAKLPVLRWLFFKLTIVQIGIARLSAHNLSLAFAIRRACYGSGVVRVVTVSAKLLKPVCTGEVSERFKEHAWKACVGEILPWVQIPPSPPLPLFCCIYRSWCLSWCLLCTGFPPVIGGKEACRHVQARQWLRQRNSR